MCRYRYIYIYTHHLIYIMLGLKNADPDRAICATKIWTQPKGAAARDSPLADLEIGSLASSFRKRSGVGAVWGRWGGLYLDFLGPKVAGNVAASFTNC